MKKNIYFFVVSVGLVLLISHDSYAMYRQMQRFLPSLRQYGQSFTPKTVGEPSSVYMGTSPSMARSFSSRFFQSPEQNFVKSSETLRNAGVDSESLQQLQNSLTSKYLQEQRNNLYPSRISRLLGKTPEEELAGKIGYLRKSSIPEDEMQRLQKNLTEDFFSRPQRIAAQWQVAEEENRQEKERLRPFFPLIGLVAVGTALKIYDNLNEPKRRLEQYRLLKELDRLSLNERLEQDRLMKKN